jgi:hypothetical protein
MKIIVNNEYEKKLINTFLEMLHEEMLDTIKMKDEELASSMDSYLDPDDYDFLVDGIYHAIVTVSDAVRPMTIEPHNIMGVCASCGKQTSGTIDGMDIDYADFIHMTKPESLDSWRCETCFHGEE